MATMTIYSRSTNWGTGTFDHGDAARMVAGTDPYTYLAVATFDPIYNLTNVTGATLYLSRTTRDTTPRANCDNDVGIRIKAESSSLTWDSNFSSTAMSYTVSAGAGTKAIPLASNIVNAIKTYSYRIHLYIKVSGSGNIAFEGQSGATPYLVVTYDDDGGGGDPGGEGGDTPSTGTGNIKYYNGTAWVGASQVKYYDGTTWRSCSAIKYYDGTAWR